MRQFLSGFLLLFSTTVFGQTNDSITFCSQSFMVPAGCTVGSNKVRCGDFDIGWTYISDVNARGATQNAKLEGMEDAYLEMSSNMEKFKKKKITLYLLNKEVKGYKVSYKSASNITYHIYASGVINGQAVSVILNLSKEPITNDDIPAFARQIIHLTK